MEHRITRNSIKGILGRGLCKLLVRSTNVSVKLGRRLDCIAQAFREAVGLIQYNL